MKKPYSSPQIVAAATAVGDNERWSYQCARGHRVIMYVGSTWQRVEASHMLCPACVGPVHSPIQVQAALARQMFQTCLLRPVARAEVKKGE
jgi:uncharacterized protein CbrC (UPF0167 family)